MAGSLQKACVGRGLSVRCGSEPTQGVGALCQVARHGGGPAAVPFDRAQGESAITCTALRMHTCPARGAVPGVQVSDLPLSYVEIASSPLAVRNDRPAADFATPVPYHLTRLDRSDK
jgi:hypothetical protein